MDSKGTPRGVSRYALRLLAWTLANESNLSLILLSQNGSFAFSSPDACSPIDPTPHSCARGEDNDVGFYECAPSE